MGTGFHDLAGLDDGDEVGVADGGEPVSDDDGSAADGGIVESILDDSFGFGV